MPRLIRSVRPELVEGRISQDPQVVDDPWVLLREASALSELPETGPVLVPLALWRTERAALIARGAVGVLLGPADEPTQIAADLAHLAVIAVDFPSFGDGRGFSTAHLLRARYGYLGELRAVGDVLRDQLFALRECGFDSFALRADRDPVEALASLDDFRDGTYAPSIRTPPLPWFRRREKKGGSGLTLAHRPSVEALM